MKITFIGAGSIGFTRKLIADILTVPAFHELEICLEDIDKKNLEMIHGLVKRDIDSNGLHRVRLTTSLDQREAVSGARYVFSVARVGGASGLRDRHRDSPSLWDRPVRRRHDMRRRDNVRPAHLPLHPRALQRHPRGGGARSDASQLLESHGDEYLGGQPVRRRPDGWPLPWSPARPPVDRRGARPQAERGRHRLRRD